MKYYVVSLCIALCTLWQDAHASTVGRIRELNAVGACQSALPVFDGNIRKRPKAIQNEGSDPAFVTCSFMADNAPTEVAVHASRVDGQSYMLSCHGIPGYNGQSLPSVLKTAELKPKATLLWFPSDWSEDAAQLPSRLFSISCLLQPGVGITWIRIYFREEIGA